MWRRCHYFHLYLLWGKAWPVQCLANGMSMRKYGNIAVWGNVVGTRHHAFTIHYRPDILTFITAYPADYLH